MLVETRLSIGLISFVLGATQSDKLFYMQRSTLKADVRVVSILSDCGHINATSRLW